MRVGLLVAFLTIVIVIGLLEECEAENEKKGGEIGKKETYFEHADELAEGYEEEEEVEEVAELVEEN